jgi:dolichyl-phosphate beta-glucosyltransferase
MNATSAVVASRATEAAKSASGGRFDHELTVVLPAFNEEARLPCTLRELGRFLDQWGIDYRVVVADDGSSDGTAALAGQRGPRFSTISLDRHRGKGAAVRAAMMRAAGRVVAFTDADLPFELSSLRDGYLQIRGNACEVVFGARDLGESNHRVRRRLPRTMATWAFRQVARRFISHEVTDTQCGFKLFSRRAAHEIFSRLTIEGFAFDAEVVLLTERLKLEYRRLPVRLVREYNSTLSLSRDALPMLRDIAGLWWRSRDWQGVPPPHWPLPESAKRLDIKHAA